MEMLPTLGSLYSRSPAPLTWNGHLTNMSFSCLRGLGLPIDVSIAIAHTFAYRIAIENGDLRPRKRLDIDNLDILGLAKETVPGALFVRGLLNPRATSDWSSGARFPRLPCDRSPLWYLRQASLRHPLRIGIYSRSVVVGGSGLEPLTSAMSRQHSNQLS